MGQRTLINLALLLVVAGLALVIAFAPDEEPPLALEPLSHENNDETLIDIPVRNAPDQDFELSHTSAVLSRIGTMFGLPALLLGTGYFIWRRRRRL